MWRSRLRKAIFESEFATRALGFAAAFFLRALGATWRISTEGPDPFRTSAGPHLGAMWHRNAIVGAYYFRDRNIGAAVSRSRDGELITRLLLRLGFRMPSRGSSSRGGAAALLGLVRLVEAGTTITIQTDGPRGPARVSKVGIVSLARQTDQPITPLTFSARPCIQFKSWDGTLLPLPFARVLCSYGEPLAPPQDMDAEESVRVALDDELNRSADEADARFDLVDPNRKTT
jgi:lysophospholipid acyltransferase (LPLAT)-like uncharacterized protein